MVTNSSSGSRRDSNKSATARVVTGVYEFKAVLYCRRAIKIVSKAPSRPSAVEVLSPVTGSHSYTPYHYSNHLTKRAREVCIAVRTTHNAVVSCVPRYATYLFLA